MGHQSKNAVMFCIVFSGVLFFQNPLYSSTGMDSSVSAVAQADTNVIHLINIFKNKKFSVKNKSGNWYEGYVAVDSTGIHIYNKKFETLTDKKFDVVQVVPWSELMEIRLLEFDKGSFRKGMVIGSIVSASWWLYVLIGLSSGH